VDNPEEWNASSFGFEIAAKTEITQHLKERVMALGEAHIFQIIVLAAARTHFCDVRPCCIGLSTPRKTSLNWFMPGW